jgi:predicted RNase H-like HicB family nuclease
VTVGNPGARLPLVLTYSRCEDGYVASLEGSVQVGRGASVDDALDALEEDLRLWVEQLDDEADEYPWYTPGERGESETSRQVRQLLFDDCLRFALADAAARTEPVLDAADEPPDLTHSP